jgi:competence protein ComEC
MLVDGGGRLSYGRPRPSNLDIGEDVVSPYLWTRGIRHIDILVATHDHQDHTGGLAALLENFHPTQLWTGANPPQSLLATAARHQIPVIQQRTAPAFPYSGATVQILAPAPSYTAAQPGNNDSLAFRLTYGIRSFLLTGDIERPIENRLLAAGVIAPVDVLKVAHHGSRSSSTEAFLEAASPAIALISAGLDNSYGHPHPDVLQRLAALHATVLRTDQAGLLTARTDGTRLWFDTGAWQQLRQETRQRLALPVHLIH